MYKVTQAATLLRTENWICDQFVPKLAESIGGIVTH